MDVIPFYHVNALVSDVLRSNQRKLPLCQRHVKHCKNRRWTSALQRIGKLQKKPLLWLNLTPRVHKLARIKAQAGLGCSLGAPCVQGPRNGQTIYLIIKIYFREKKNLTPIGHQKNITRITFTPHWPIRSIKIISS